jgi:hypothetical protein
VRAGKGKVLENQDKRFSDTNRHTLTWWENNPVSAETRRSVGAVNKLHIHYAKQYPDDMTNNDDYIYGLCTEAAAFHRFREMIGLPGYTSAMQVTAYRFWSDMVPLFQSGDGAALTGWPADFQGVLDVMAKFESRSWPYTEDSVIACEAVRKQFAERYFPRPLQGLGRTMVLAMYPEHVLKTLRLKAPNRFIVRAVRAALKANILLQERVLPDPRETISERLMAKGSPSAGVLGVGACPYVPEASPVRQDR